jgi:hypothetical protein
MEGDWSFVYTVYCTPCDDSLRFFVPNSKFRVPCSFSFFGQKRPKTKTRSIRLSVTRESEAPPSIQPISTHILRQLVA